MLHFRQGVKIELHAGKGCFELMTCNTDKLIFFPVTVSYFIHQIVKLGRKDTYFVFSNYINMAAVIAAFADLFHHIYEVKNWCRNITLIKVCDQECKGDTHK